MSRLGILYISYDGMMEPLGQSQVLAYLERLATSRPIYLISFEKSNDTSDLDSLEILSQRMNAAGILWYPLRYHKRPSAVATAYDILTGVTLGFWLIFRFRLRIIHARSYVAGVIALTLKKITNAMFIFDMRGFWADERVDGGLWRPNSLLFRIAKWFEKKFLLAADHVISLTEAGVEEIRKFDYLLSCPPPSNGNSYLRRPYTLSNTTLWSNGSGH